MKHRQKPVIFAGAGPGDPELITVKAKNALANADLIIFAGSLVPEAVLCWKSKHTKTVSSAGMTLDQIIEMIKTHYRQNKNIVRLHTGDPALYGAIFEQMCRLDGLDIPYTVIPGVTAAFAASAKMNIEYTLPQLTQTLILTRISGRTPVPDKENLSSLAAHNASMAIYLSIGQIEDVKKIIEHHYGKDSLCAVAYKVSHPDEKIFYCKASDLSDCCQRNQITRHALVIVGKSVENCRGKNPTAASRLYDAAFSHGYRSAKK